MAFTACQLRYEGGLAGPSGERQRLKDARAEPEARRNWARRVACPPARHGPPRRFGSVARWDPVEWQQTLLPYIAGYWLTQLAHVGLRIVWDQEAGGPAIKLMGERSSCSER